MRIIHFRRRFRLLADRAGVELPKDGDDSKEAREQADLRAALL